MSELMRTLMIGPFRLRLYVEAQALDVNLGKLTHLEPRATPSAFLSAGWNEKWYEGQATGTVDQHSGTI